MEYKMKKLFLIMILLLTVSVLPQAKLDNNNYLNGTLAHDSIWVGNAVDLLTGIYPATIRVSAYVTTMSASNGLRIQFSINGTTWQDSSCYNISALNGVLFDVKPHGRYYRVKYVNGLSDR